LFDERGKRKKEEMEEEILVRRGKRSNEEAEEAPELVALLMKFGKRLLSLAVPEWCLDPVPINSIFLIK